MEFCLQEASAGPRSGQFGGAQQLHRASQGGPDDAGSRGRLQRADQGDGVPGAGGGPTRRHHAAMQLLREHGDRGQRFKY